MFTGARQYETEPEIEPYYDPFDFAEPDDSEQEASRHVDSEIYRLLESYPEALAQLPDTDIEPEQPSHVVCPPGTRWHQKILQCLPGKWVTK